MNILYNHKILVKILKLTLVQYYELNYHSHLGFCRLATNVLILSNAWDSALHLLGHWSLTNIIYTLASLKTHQMPLHLISFSCSLEAMYSVFNQLRGIHIERKIRVLISESSQFSWFFTSSVSYLRVLPQCIYIALIPWSLASCPFWLNLCSYTLDQDSTR